MDARRRRSGCMSGYRIALLGRRRRGTGRPRAGAASRCSTSPSGTCRSAPTRCSSRRTGCGPSTSATRRWSSGRSANETYAAALDDPDDALGRAYGMPTPIAFDLEWYATAPAGRPVGRRRLRAGRRRARRRSSCAGGAARTDRGAGAPLAPVGRPRSARSCCRTAFAHTGVRAPFAFPDGTSPTGCSPRTAGGRVLRVSAR